ncbi:YcaO-like family protein [Dactylosporangium sp. CA-233914]|uniref:YcaO-like family protein n=1 Tax=Dactylosporangium sp. CA-233914 TaxID=3239934 RepID=UPI003D938AC2
MTVVRGINTYRSTTAEETWDRVRPLLPAIGVTRVADLTGLDDIGLPSHAAYRPVSRTLTVSLGIGLTPAPSKVSAVMEGAEAWHAENPCLPVVARCAAAELDVPYHVRDLQLALNSPLTDRTVLHWVAGHGLLTGRTVLVPLETVRLDFAARRDWARVLFRPTSNGLAAGNTLAEATLHGLQELIERECITEHTETDPARRVYADPAQATVDSTVAIVEALRAAGCWTEVCDVTNDLGVPCYGATVWSPSLPLIFGGFGCHVEPEIALGRALAEAVQSRMAAVSGARDDLHPQIYEQADPLARPPVHLDRPMRPLRPAPPVPSSIEAVIADYAARVFARTGIEPFAVDLTHEALGLPVCKVYAPRLRMFQDSKVTRPGR